MSETPSAATAAATAPETFDVPLADLRTRQSFKWRAHPGNVIPSFIAEMDFALAPPVRAALQELLDRSDSGYSGAFQELGESYAAFSGERFGWSPDPARVQAVPDVVVGLVEVLRTLTRPGEGVIVNTPVYPPFFYIIEEVGCHVVEAPLAAGEDGFELDFDAVEAALAAGTRVWLLCNPHNPTGDVLTRAELERAVELATRYDAIIVSDEIHAPLVMRGAQHVPILSLGEAAERCAIVLTAGSKAFNLAGLKCGLVISASKAMDAAVKRLPVEIELRAGHWGMLASIAAFRHGGPWLDELLDVLDGNRRLLGELLAERLPAVRYAPPQATFLAWLDMRELGLGDDPAAWLLKHGDVALASGADFGTVGAGYARLVFGTPPSVLRETVERIARAYEARA